jgi:hypothetical protein
MAFTLISGLALPVPTKQASNDAVGFAYGPLNRLPQGGS